MPITERQNALFPGTAEAGTASIRVMRLADALPASGIESPALLKLDVQGFELQALAGCEDVLDRFAWVYVECSFEELYARQAFADAVIAWLRVRGFALRGVYNPAYGDAEKSRPWDFSARRIAVHARDALPGSMACAIDPGRGFLPRTGSAE